MKLAVPDLISPSYFPALAAAELGFFEREGLEVSAELIFPVDRAYEALRDGAIDFVGGAAHGALAAFTEWRGVKLLGALSQGMYWFLVMRADLGIARGDLAALKGRKIGAAPWVEMGLRGLLTAAGLEPRRNDIHIGPVPGATGPGVDLASVNFGLTAAQALENGVLLNSPQPDALRFMPALNVTREEIAPMIENLDAILTRMGAARRVA